MNSLQNETAAFVLEAAINGITKSYLSENERVNDLIALSESVQMLVRDEMLIELADKDRNFVAYKTTEKGIKFVKTFDQMGKITGPMAIETRE